MTAARVRWGLLVLVGLFGVFVGGLMTQHHDVQLFGGGEAGQLIGCEESAAVNCDIVNTSEWSELAGVPIATLGIAFYGAVAVLGVLGLRGRAVGGLVVGAGVFAVAYSVFLYTISTTQLNYVCAWCMRLYAANALILVLGLSAGRPRLPDGGTQRAAALVYVGLLVLSVGGERAYRASLLGDAPTVELAHTPGDHDRSRDPEGPAPAMRIPVTTEDKNEVTLVIEPQDAWTGNRDAQVAVVMFGDLECGYCKRTGAEMARLEAAYGDRVLFVFKHFPLDPTCNPGVKNRKHRDACEAARAAVCAQDQGVFWAFHDLSYKNQHQLGREYLDTYAAQAGADPAAFASCMQDPASAARVAADGQAGKDVDVHGTPRIFIGGKLYRSGSSAEVMARAVEAALGANAKEAADRASALREDNTRLTPVPEDAQARQWLELGELRFSIDAFEATIEDGKAVSRRRAVPALRTSWFQAKAACEAAGRRLCTEQEWVSACQNAAAVDDNGNGEFADDMIEGTTYPYGDFHDRGRCWDGKDRAKERPLYTGELPACVTPTGLYDMTGNVEEWVGTSPETAVLLGGAFDTSSDHARCYRRNDTFGAGYAAPRTGFRCCGEGAP